MGNAFSDTDFEDSTKGDDWSKSATGFTERDGVNSSEEESAYKIATFDTREDDEDGRKFGVTEDNDYTHGAGRQASPSRINRKSPVKDNRTIDSSDTGEQAGWERTGGVFDGREYKYDSRSPVVKKKSPISPILAQIRSEIPQDGRGNEFIMQNGSSYDDDDYESWYYEYNDRYKTGMSPISLASRFWTTSGTDEDDEGIETRLKPRHRSPRWNRQSKGVLSPSNRNAASPSRNLSPASRVWTTVDGDEDDEGIETALKLRKKSPKKSTALADSSENDWSGSSKTAGTKDPPARERRTGYRSPKSPHAANLPDKVMKDLIETFARELVKNIAREGTPSNFNIFEEISKRVAQSTQSPMSADVAKDVPSTKDVSSTLEQKIISPNTKGCEEIQRSLDATSPKTVERTNASSPGTERMDEGETEPIREMQTQNTVAQDTAIQEAVSKCSFGEFPIEPFASMVTAPKALMLDKSKPGSRRITPAAQISGEACVTKPTRVVLTTEASAQAPVTQTSPAAQSTVTVHVPLVEEDQPQEDMKQQGDAIREEVEEDKLAVSLVNKEEVEEDKLAISPANKEEVEEDELAISLANKEEVEEDELAISPAASALEVVRAASPLITLTSEDFEDVDMKFVQQYDKTFEAFVEAHPTLSQENVDMIMYLRVAKLQKLFEVVDDLEDAFQKKLEKLRTQKKLMTSNYQRELLNATKEKAGREIHLRQELRMLRETTQLLEAKLNWELFLKHKSRADNQFDLLQQLWTKTINPEDPISALPESMVMQEIRDAATNVKPETDEVDEKSKVDGASVKTSATATTFEHEVTKLELEVSSENDVMPEKKEGEETPFVTPFENDFGDKEETAATKKEMKDVQMDNAFLNAEISVLENKLAYVKSKSHKDMWVDTMFHQLGSNELARFKKKFEEDVGVPV